MYREAQRRIETGDSYLTPELVNTAIASNKKGTGTYPTLSTLYDTLWQQIDQANSGDRQTLASLAAEVQRRYQEGSLTREEATKLKEAIDLNRANPTLPTAEDRQRVREAAQIQNAERRAELERRQQGSLGKQLGILLSTVDVTNPEQARRLSAILNTFARDGMPDGINVEDVARTLAATTERRAGMSDAEKAKYDRAAKNLLSGLGSVTDLGLETTGQLPAKAKGYYPPGAAAPLADALIDAQANGRKVFEITLNNGSRAYVSTTESTPTNAQGRPYDQSRLIYDPERPASMQYPQTSTAPPQGGAELAPFVPRGLRKSGEELGRLRETVGEEGVPPEVDFQQLAEEFIKRGARVQDLPLSPKLGETETPETTVRLTTPEQDAARLEADAVELGAKSLADTYAERPDLSDGIKALLEDQVQMSDDRAIDTLLDTLAGRAGGNIRRENVIGEVGRIISDINSKIFSTSPEPKVPKQLQDASDDARAVYRQARRDAKANDTPENKAAEEIALKNFVIAERKVTQIIKDHNIKILLKNMQELNKQLRSSGYGKFIKDILINNNYGSPSLNVEFYHPDSLKKTITFRYTLSTRDYTTRSGVGTTVKVDQPRSRSILANPDSYGADGGTLLVDRPDRVIGKDSSTGVDVLSSSQLYVQESLLGPQPRVSLNVGTPGVVDTISITIPRRGETAASPGEYVKDLQELFEYHTRGIDNIADNFGLDAKDLKLKLFDDYKKIADAVLRDDNPWEKSKSSLIISKEINPRIAKAVRKIFSLFGINRRVLFITNDELKRGDGYMKYGLTGQLIRLNIASDTRNAFVNSITIDGIKHSVITLDSAFTGTDYWTTLGHEIGHVIFDEALTNAPEPVQKMLYAAYRASVRRLSARGPEAFIREVRPPDIADRALRAGRTPEQIAKSAEYVGYVEPGKQEPTGELPSYEGLRTYSEWFSDQVSRFFVSETKVVNVLDRYFKSIADKIKQLYYTLKGESVLRPDTTAESFLREVIRVNEDSNRVKMQEGTRYKVYMDASKIVQPQAVSDVNVPTTATATAQPSAQGSTTTAPNPTVTAAELPLIIRYNKSKRAELEAKQPGVFRNVLRAMAQNVVGNRDGKRKVAKMLMGLVRDGDLTPMDAEDMVRMMRGEVTDPTLPKYNDAQYQKAMDVLGRSYTDLNLPDDIIAETYGTSDLQGIQARDPGYGVMREYGPGKAKGTPQYEREKAGVTWRNDSFMRGDEVKGKKKVPGIPLMTDGLLGPGYYLTQSEATAREYGNTVSRYDVDIKNPLVVETVQGEIEVTDGFARRVDKTLINGVQVPNPPETWVEPMWFAIANELGIKNPAEWTERQMEAYSGIGHPTLKREPFYAEPTDTEEVVKPRNAWRNKLKAAGYDGIFLVAKDDAGNKYIQEALVLDEKQFKKLPEQAKETAKLPARYSPLEESILNAPELEYNPQDTSIAQKPLAITQGVKRAYIQPGTVNLDIGGGKYNEGTDYLLDYEVENILIDPYAREREINLQNLARLKEIAPNGADSATLSSVLNVIREPEIQKSVLMQAYDGVKNNGQVIIAIYEGNGTGVGAVTNGNTFQHNRKTADYMPLVESIFGAGNVTRSGNLIIATKSPSGPSGGVVMGAFGAPVGLGGLPDAVRSAVKSTQQAFEKLLKTSVESTKRYGTVEEVTMADGTTRSVNRVAEAAQAFASARGHMVYVADFFTKHVTRNLSPEQYDLFGRYLVHLRREAVVRRIKSQQRVRNLLWSRISTDPQYKTMRSRLSAYEKELQALNIKSAAEDPNAVTIPGMTPEELARVQSDPELQRSLQVYTDEVAPELQKMRQFLGLQALQDVEGNAFVRLKAVKPGQKAIAARVQGSDEIVTETGDETVFTGGGATPTSRERLKGTNRSAALGTAELYETDFETLMQHALERDLYNYRQAEFIQTLQQSGVAVPLPAGQRAPSKMTVNGKEVDAGVIDVRAPILAVEEITGNPADSQIVPEVGVSGQGFVRTGQVSPATGVVNRYLVPRDVKAEYEDLVQRVESPLPKEFTKEYMQVRDAFTKLQLAFPGEATAHAWRVVNILSALPIPSDARGAMLKRLVPYFGGRAQALQEIFNVDMSPGSDDVKLGHRIAKFGAIPSRSIKDMHNLESQGELNLFSSTVSQIADFIGKLKYSQAIRDFVFSMPTAEGKGFGGIDIRARIAAAKIYLKFNPKATDVELADFANQFGNYTQDLQSKFVRDAKKFGFSFAGFQSQAIPTELARYFGYSGINLENVPPAERLMIQAQVLWSNALGTAVTTALLNQIFTGQWPWEDPTLAPGEVVLPLDLAGKDRRVVIPASAFNPVSARSGSWLGATGAYKAAQSQMTRVDLPRYLEYIGEEALKGTVNAALSTAGPPIRIPVGLAAGKILYLNRDGDLGDLQERGEGISARIPEVMERSAPFLETLRKGIELATETPAERRKNLRAAESTSTNIFSLLYNMYSPIKTEFRPSQRIGEAQLMQSAGRRTKDIKRYQAQHQDQADLLKLIDPLLNPGDQTKENL